MPILDRDEYIEQAYLFRTLHDRLKVNVSTQDLLTSLKDEILSTTTLVKAVDLLVTEMRFSGLLTPALKRLPHYFHPFQTFVIASTEEERAKLDFSTALRILEKEALYRASGPTPQGLFIYQFEALCRNRMGYDQGLAAVAADPLYEPEWREWIELVRRHVGIFDFADLLYARSAYRRQVLARDGEEPFDADKPDLFGEKEGKIAFAHRLKDPLFMFSALERHLGYPTVPRPLPPDQDQTKLPDLVRLVRRLEQRVKLLEEEARGGIDLQKLYGPGPSAAPPTEDIPPLDDEG